MAAVSRACHFRYQSALHLKRDILSYLVMRSTWHTWLIYKRYKTLIGSAPPVSRRDTEIFV